MGSQVVAWAAKEAGGSAGLTFQPVLAVVKNGCLLSIAS